MSFRFLEDVIYGFSQRFVRVSLMVSLVFHVGFRLRVLQGFSLGSI